MPFDSLDLELCCGITFKLRKKELLEQYSVDEDDLLGVFSVLNGRSQATIGSGPISTAEYVRYLQDVWQAGVCTAHALGSQHDHQMMKRTHRIIHTAKLSMRRRGRDEG